MDSPKSGQAVMAALRGAHSVMKRKQAVVWGESPTICFLSREQINAIQNGLFPSCPSVNETFDCEHVIDHSYIENCRTRRIFDGLDDGIDCFFMGRFFHDSVTRRAAYYAFGWRVVAEFLDDRVLLDVIDPLDDDACPRSKAVAKIVENLNVKHDVILLGDNDIICVFIPV